jgi:predicted ATPase
MTMNIASAIRKGGGPTDDLAELSAQAQRLRKALRVAEKWVEDARPNPEMLNRAEGMRQYFEEELARVCFEMDVVSDRSGYERAREHFGHEVPEDGAEAHAGELRESLISNTLLHAYCTLAAAPLDIFGMGDREAE